MRLSFNFVKLQMLLAFIDVSRSPQSINKRGKSFDTLVAVNQILGDTKKLGSKMFVNLLNKHAYC
jgi:hypothetical protein